MRILQEKLHTLNKSLDHHKGLLQDYDNTIKETESGFRKVYALESPILCLIVTIIPDFGEH